MKECYGNALGPLVLVHGGAGPMDPTVAFMKEATEDAIAIARSCLKVIASEDPLEAVEIALMGFEDHPNFNAGIGSALQADGLPRLTAAMMDGQKQRFSGVISLSHVRHPSRIARHLQSMRSRVLTNPGADLMARELGLPVENLITDRRLSRYTEKATGGLRLADTVGVVVLNARGVLAAGTSTGGRGHEYPGRVSDSATVAGNYASEFIATSATGIGEEIVDDALCARLETRVRDGLSLKAASQRCFQEAKTWGRSYGWIALGRDGSWASCHTSPAMSYALVDAEGTLLASSSPI